MVSACGGRVARQQEPMDHAITATKKGLLREWNPGPLAPEARIIPLDQAADEN